MSTERRFLVASSIARLIRREHPEFSRVVEGYFPPRPDRTHWVRVEREQSHLVLRTHEGGEVRDEQSELPLSHAAALMDVAAGRVAYDRTAITLAPGLMASVDRYLLPVGLDILTVADGANPHFFAPPPWAGREVSEEADFDAVRLALHGLPVIDEGPVPNFALEALLDWLDGRSQVETTARLETGETAPAERSDRSTGPGAGTTLRPASFRGEAPEADDGVVRLARNLAPRRNAGS